MEMPRAVYGIHKVMLHTDWLDVPVLMDAAAASIVLGLKYETVRKAMQEGRLPAEKVMGTQWRIRKDKLMAHLGYADWEIERYGFGMPTPAQGRGFNPVIQDDFSTALNESRATATTVTLEELPVYVVQTSSADGNSLRLPPAAESTSLEEGGYGAGEEVSAEELERLSGMWVEDPAPYLVDMRHPVAREEWDNRQLRLGRLPWEPEPLRERRQFDREMVAKYGRIYPPPKRAKWVLDTHDIIDQQEEREMRRSIAAARVPVYEEVYIDEEI